MLNPNIVFKHVIHDCAYYQVESQEHADKLAQSGGLFARYADVNNVKKGQKAKPEFETDVYFEKLEPTVSWFEVEE